jgi:hypothetical protein
MKKEIKFNHDAETLTEAIGVDVEHAANQMRNAVELFVKDERTKLSVLTEMIHKHIDYDVLLLIATDELANKAKKVSALSQLKELLDDLMDD